MMAGVSQDARLTEEELKGRMNDVAKGFSDKDWGAGIRLYYVIDNSAATPT